jgi:hypothetical protein
MAAGTSPAARRMEDLRAVWEARRGPVRVTAKANSGGDSEKRRSGGLRWGAYTSAQRFSSTSHPSTLPARNCLARSLPRQAASVRHPGDRPTRRPENATSNCPYPTHKRYNASPKGCWACSAGGNGGTRTNPCTSRSIGLRRRPEPGLHPLRDFVRKGVDAGAKDAPVIPPQPTTGDHRCITP